MSMSNVLPAADTIRLLIVDDQALVRAGFRMILDAQPDLEVVGEAGDGAEACDLAAQLEPDVVLIDIRMPVLDGLEATRRILSRDPAARVVILTTYDLDEYVYDALVAGASGFLLKDVPPEDLVSGVRLVAAGDALLAPSVTRRLIAEFVDRHDTPTPVLRSLESLTPRELDVLRLIGRGRSNPEIAGDLLLSENTVKSHVTRVFDKLGLRDRAQAVIAAYEARLIEPGTS